MQRYVHNVYRSHAQSEEGFDTPSAPCVPVNEGQDIHLSGLSRTLATPARVLGRFSIGS